MTGRRYRDSSAVIPFEFEEGVTKNLETSQWKSLISDKLVEVFDKTPPEISGYSFC